MKNTIIAAVLCSLLSLPLPAQDWAQWRGPNRDGVISRFTAPAVWPDKLKLKWKTPVGTGYSSPVVAQGKAYVLTRRADAEAAVCVELNTGKELWSASYPAPFTHNQYAVQMQKGPYATPLLHHGKLYTLGTTAILSCFDARTGKLEWRKEFDRPDTSKMFCGTAASPLIERGNLIVYVGDDLKGGQMIAFDAATGKEKWTWRGPGPGYSSPIAAEFDGVRQIVTMSDKSVVGIGANDGRPLWQIAWLDEWNENIVTPTLYKNTLLLSGVRKGTMAVQPTKSGDKWEAKQLWHNAEVQMYMNSPVLDGDFIYGLAHKRKGQFFCLAAATGKVRWQTEGRAGTNAAVLKAGDLLFFLTTDAALIVAKKNAEQFEQLAQYAVADSAVYAHPVILPNGILIKDASSLALWGW